MQLTQSRFDFTYLATLLSLGATLEEVMDYVHQAAIIELAVGTVFDCVRHTDRICVDGYDDVSKLAKVSYGDMECEVYYDRSNPSPEDREIILFSKKVTNE